MQRAVTVEQRPDVASTGGSLIFQGKLSRGCQSIRQYVSSGFTSQKDLYLSNVLQRIAFNKARQRMSIFHDGQSAISHVRILLRFVQEWSYGHSHNRGEDYDRSGKNV